MANIRETQLSEASRSRAQAARHLLPKSGDKCQTAPHGRAQLGDYHLIFLAGGQVAAQHFANQIHTGPALFQQVANDGDSDRSAAWEMLLQNAGWTRGRRVSTRLDH